MKKILIITSVFSAIIMLNSCGSKSDDETAKPEITTEAAPPHANENTATLSEEQMKTIGIELGSIEQKELTNSVKANGILTEIGRAHV